MTDVQREEEVLFVHCVWIREDSVYTLRTLFK